MSNCRLLVDNSWETATLSDEEIAAVKADLQGQLQKEYLITLDSGEIIETGIVDSIKAL